MKMEPQVFVCTGYFHLYPDNGDRQAAQGPPQFPNFSLVLDCSQLQMVCPVPLHKAPGLPLLSIPNKPPNISHQKTHAYGISTVQREQYRRANSYLWCTSAADHCLRCEVPGSNKLGVSEVVCDLVTRGRIKCI